MHWIYWAHPPNPHSLHVFSKCPTAGSDFQRLHPPNGSLIFQTHPLPKHSIRLDRKHTTPATLLSYLLNSNGVTILPANTPGTPINDDSATSGPPSAVFALPSQPWCPEHCGARARSSFVSAPFQAATAAARASAMFSARVGHKQRLLASSSGRGYSSNKPGPFLTQDAVLSPSPVPPKHSHAPHRLGYRHSPSPRRIPLPLTQSRRPRAPTPSSPGRPHHHQLSPDPAA